MKNRTLANLSHWPAAKVEALRAVLRGDNLVPAGEGLEIVRAMPHGHVVAVFGTLKRIGLDRLLARGPKRRRDLALALIVARLVDPASKLATARALDQETASHSLGAVSGLGRVAANEVYDALDWLLAQQDKIEKGLARRHLKDGTLVLYDLTSTYLEGRCCLLARHGYSRDHSSDRLQIVFGLLCSQEGCPVGVEVFAGNAADPGTLKAQIDKLKRRFGLSHVVLVGARGLITQARVREDCAPAGLDWITALRRRRASPCRAIELGTHSRRSGRGDRRANLLCSLACQRSRTRPLLRRQPNGGAGCGCKAAAARHRAQG